MLQDRENMQIEDWTLLGSSVRTHCQQDLSPKSGNNNETIPNRKSMKGGARLKNVETIQLDSNRRHIKEPIWLLLIDLKWTYISGCDRTWNSWFWMLLYLYLVWTFTVNTRGCSLCQKDVIEQKRTKNLVRNCVQTRLLKEAANHWRTRNQS